MKEEGKREGESRECYATFKPKNVLKTAVSILNPNLDILLSAQAGTLGLLAEKCQSEPVLLIML